MLFLLSEIVTFTVSSFKANSLGEGKKSSTTFTSPIGSSVYFIFSFIDLLPLSPISGADDSDLAIAISESYRHNSIRNVAQAILPLFLSAVRHIFQYDTVFIQKGELSQPKGNAVFDLI